MDIITKTRHSRLWKSSSMASVNDRLAGAVLNSGEFRLGTLTLRSVQCHLGPGFYPPSHDPKPHQHMEAQIEIPLSGRFHFTVGGSKVLVRPTQALLIPAGTLHHWRTPGGFMLGIQLSAKDGCRKEASLPPKRKVGARLVSTPALTAHLQQLIDVAASPKGSALTPVLISSLLMILIAEVLDGTCSFPRRGGTDSHDRGHMIYEQACSFIRGNLGRNLKAQDLAAQTGISFRQITRLFHRYGNESPHQSILRLRLEKAREIIGKSPLVPIKEVAYECGFSSQAHLAVTFKKKFGVPPSEYAIRKVLK